eukprot:COSAG06_NODE_121_length_23085_cov_7.727791_18_plen_60_part_00
MSGGAASAFVERRSSSWVGAGFIGAIPAADKLMMVIFFQRIFRVCSAPAELFRGNFNPF